MGEPGGRVDRDFPGRGSPGRAEGRGRAPGGLSGGGLFAAETAGAGWACRYGPHNPEREALLQKVLQLYRERPVSMIKLVAARAKNPLRNFADAFRVRPREGE